MGGKRIADRKRERGRGGHVMPAFLYNRWTDLAVRWILGLTFIVASIHKISEPAAFAKIIYGYGLFPHFSINLLAIVLPFVEVVTGLFLLLNIYPKAAATLVGIMLIAFILAITINMVRGYEFDCGCFSFGSKNTLAGKNFLLIRDVILLVLCIYLVRFSDNILEKRAING
jgi:uncharacterized membrane protein YphA (DoxX/SURF4 family)